MKIIKHDNKIISHSTVEWITTLRDNGPNIASTILSAISLGISFYLLYRLNGLFTLLMGFQKVLSANLTMTQWEVPDFHLPNPSNPDLDPILATSNSTLSDSAIDNVYDDSLSSHHTSGLAIGFYFLLLVLLGVIIVKVVKCALKYRSGRYHIIGPANTQVHLKITYAGDTYAFCVCPVYHNISAIKLPICPRVNHIRAPRFMSHQIKVTWTDASIFEYWAGSRLHTIAFPSSFHVPKGYRSLVRSAIHSGVYEASISLSDAHGNTMELRRDALNSPRGIEL